MNKKVWALLLLHGMLWPVVGVGIYAYATTPHQMTFLKILGSTEPDLALKVFAQFIVTQTFSFDTPFVATELLLPAYLPEEALPIKISLYQDDTFVTWWRYPQVGEEIKEGSVVARLPFIVPTALYGKVEIRFDGRTILHDLQDHAPRLFTETFDSAYPHGNYRIADNEKKGDIALELIGQKTNYELLAENVRTNMLGEGTRILTWLSVAILLACLPSVIVNPFFTPKRTGP